ncbi:retrovirus-related Pol polyprotein from transposon opus [Trichonephila clavipes]|uniref:Retrovirus-related Pol polyprotein from transposon opus n=1 Tax=Trichonephila clavipes TaxID=2585209 RepID=A0A8X6RAH5_TRICX|nr:retrovirus-related Pol polyprotein from transposon opus [Trichonephila clavipes]
MDTSGSMCNFLAENIDRLKTLKVKCLDVILDGTVDSGAQISEVRADLVKDIESTGEGKIKLISAFGDSETTPLRTFSIRIDDGWDDAVPITCAVSKKLVNDMLVCQTAYEALLENIQLCCVNARQVIDDDNQLDENKSSIVCEVQTFEESSCLDIEVTIDSVNIEGEVRSNLSNQGTNFTAQLTQAFQDALGASSRFSTPGHPESMGAVERWNRTLKDMLNKNIQEHGNEWDVHLPYLLFAYREIPHTLTGVSQYQLVYGRLPLGPMSILKEFWTGEREIPTSGARSVEEYLRQLQKKLQETHEIASGNSTKNQERMTSHYNLRSREKSFSVGDEVLILLPSSMHKLLNTWRGPAKVVALTRPHSCLVQMEDGSTIELHINKLRPYISRVDHVGVIFDKDLASGTDPSPPVIIPYGKNASR